LTDESTLESAVDCLLLLLSDSVDPTGKGFQRN
jgi:hypothetical protein